MTSAQWFRPAGRKRRGRIDEVLDLEPSTGCLKVKAGWPYTQPLWITPEELAAGVKEDQSRLKLR